MDHGILQIIWFFLVGVFLIGYSILDGFDLGVGSLVPFLSTNDEETHSLIKSIGPVWDGNEVWLITGGGALFAAFPHVYATVFSGFYLALMLVLFALIFRAVSIEFWALDEDNRGLWKYAFILGSFLPSLLFGVALGNVIVGIPLDASMEFRGTFFTLLRPFPLAVGLLGLVAILSQGATYAALKIEGDVQSRARELTGKLWIAYLALAVVAFGLAVVCVDGVLTNIVAWIFGLLFVAAVIVMKNMSGNGEDMKAFLASSTAFMALWGIVASMQFPVLVRATEAANSLTIRNSSSGQLTMTVMLIIGLIGMPLVIGYTIMVYRFFKGKVI